MFLFGVPAQVLAAAPSVVTSAASGITTSSAVLNGTGTPHGEPTTGRFRYSSTKPASCNDTFGTRVPAVSGTDLGSGSSAVPYSITTTGLTPGTTYYFCAIVSNASGTALGAVLSFTIPSSPVVVTSAATSVKSTSATLPGTANPLTAATTGWFRYSPTDPGACNDTFGWRAPDSDGVSLGSGVASVPFTQPITGLLPATTYYYCAIANNTYGTGFGSVRSFTTKAMVPTVTTSDATNLTRTTGLLTGYASPGGDTTTAWFRYSTLSPGTCNDTFGTRAPCYGWLGARRRQRHGRFRPGDHRPYPDHDLLLLRDRGQLGRYRVGRRPDLRHPVGTHSDDRTCHQPHEQLGHAQRFRQSRPRRRHRLVPLQHHEPR